jgi:hypothetical protein
MLQHPNPLANRRRQAAANKIFVSLPTILAQAKFVQAIPMTGMAGDILPMKALGHPMLRFQRILHDSTIQDLTQLNCVSYDVPVETNLSLVKEHMLWHEHAYGFVAYEGNKSVLGFLPRETRTLVEPFPTWLVDSGIVGTTRATSI